MVGEVLVEKTAGTVLPELESTREQVFSKTSILSLHLLVHVSDPYCHPFPSTDQMQQLAKRLETEAEEARRMVEDFKRVHNVRFSHELEPGASGATGSPGKWPLLFYASRSLSLGPPVVWVIYALFIQVSSTSKLNEFFYPIELRWPLYEYTAGTFFI